MFLPSKLLNSFYNINNNPPQDILESLAILTWIPVKEVEKYFHSKRLKENKEYEKNINRETWISHPLFKKTVADLQRMCKSNGLPDRGLKHIDIEIDIYFI